MIAFRRLVPQSSVDNADNAGVCEIADQSPDTLLELDNHFGNADIHQSVLCDGTLILDKFKYMKLHLVCFRKQNIRKIVNILPVIFGC